MKPPWITPKRIGEPRDSKESKQMSEVAERVKKIVVDHLDVDEAKVTESASFNRASGRTASTRSSW